MKDLHTMCFNARNAFYDLSVSSVHTRNSVLLHIAENLAKQKDALFAANQEDIVFAEKEGLSSPLLHRLKFGEEKMGQVCEGLNSLAGLDDPIGKTTVSTEIADGLHLYRVTCPIGVVGVIFESRPDALIQIASLCIKSGNAVLLKGGREALRTNRLLCSVVRESLQACGLSPDCAQLLESREDVQSMLKEDELIDLIIPRGSNSFVRYIMDNSRIPVLGHADGVCHVYVDQDADPALAVKICLDSKVQNVSVCNAAETFLVHEKAAPLILPELFAALKAHNVEIRGDERVANIVSCKPATDDDWSSEYLDYIVSVKIVRSLREAVNHINHFGSHHTDCIVTENKDTAMTFMNLTDSAGVYWNASTRFADGFVYGFGAEVGISTGKIHARGPMGLEGLTTYKYKLIGKGHIISEFKNGEKKYTHRPLPNAFPE